MNLVKLRSGARFVRGLRDQKDTSMTDRRERQVTGGFAVRLRQVIDAYGSANSIAKAIERSEGAVRKWLRGESEPNVTDLRALCQHTGTCVEWLVTGRGEAKATPTEVKDADAPYQPASAPIDYGFLTQVINATDEELKA